MGELARHVSEYAALGVQLVVVIAQLPASVRRYIEESGLPFDILVDESRDVLRAYGVWHRFGLDAWNIARPAVFLIDRTRQIRYSFIGQRQTEFPGHQEIMNAIRAVTSAG